MTDEIDISPEAVERLIKKHALNHEKIKQGFHTFARPTPLSVETAHCLRALLTALDAAEAEHSDALKMAAENQHWLGEILAVIHSDGGHHLNENGPEASTKSALEKWYDQLAQNEATEAKLAVAVEALQRAKTWVAKGADRPGPICRQIDDAIAQINEKGTENE